MPTTSRPWTRFAPLTARERKIRSGTSGVFAVASRATKNASSASAVAPRPSVVAAPQPCSAAGSTIV